MATQKNGWKQYLGAIIGAAAVIIAACIALLPRLQCSAPVPPVGEIISPAADEWVTSPFSVSGTLENIPGDRHVWLAVQVDNLYWPKKKINSQNRKWLVTLDEGGPSGKPFAIALLMAGRAGNARIEKWLRAGETAPGGPSFPGLELQKIPGSAILDVVAVRLVEK